TPASCVSVASTCARRCASARRLWFRPLTRFASATRLPAIAAAVAPSSRMKLARSPLRRPRNDRAAIAPFVKTGGQYLSVRSNACAPPFSTDPARPCTKWSRSLRVGESSVERIWSSCTAVAVWASGSTPPACRIGASGDRDVDAEGDQDDREDARAEVRHVEAPLHGVSVLSPWSPGTLPIC